jgi:hypothetical protein
MAEIKKTKKVVTVTAKNNKIDKATEAQIEQPIQKIQHTKSNCDKPKQKKIVDDENHVQVNDIKVFTEESANKKLKLENPISDDTLDYLDSQIDKFNETTKLGEKINIHNELSTTIKKLEKEIDDMADIIDKIDVENVKSEHNRESNSNVSSIDNDIVTLEKLVEGMKEEDILQIKIFHLQKIAEIIRNCKSKFNNADLRISKCN